ncbi:hypothetical protein Taro_015241 [Colocasia esculenta]|uniref:DUF4283 domain-containing protein n=1 Tax=Colocasia esculenta TaxID=4460 RepID=A0A843ULS7_COLES|nr:hypothetical protein [Colocasia esculenta]
MLIGFSLPWAGEKRPLSTSFVSPAVVCTPVHPCRLTLGTVVCLWMRWIGTFERPPACSVCCSVRAYLPCAARLATSPLRGGGTPPPTHPCATPPFLLGEESWAEAFPPLEPSPSSAALGTSAHPSATAHAFFAPAHVDGTAGPSGDPHATSGAAPSSAGVAAHVAGPSTRLAAPGLQAARYVSPPIISATPAAQPPPWSVPLAHNPPAASSSFAQVLLKSMSPPVLPLVAHGPAVTDQGEPAAFFTMEEIKMSCSPLELAVIARTPQGRPPFPEIRAHLAQRFPFTQDFFISPMDGRHLLIRFQNKEDFLLLLLKEFMQVQGRPFYFFKWTMDFSPDRDCPIIPVWIEMPCLPANFHHSAMICSLAGSIGPVLKMDRNTTNPMRTQGARVNVQVDVSRKLPERIWVGIGAGGYWQSVMYPDPPKFCKSCQRLGHLESNCKKSSTPRGGDGGHLSANQKPKMQETHPQQPAPKTAWKVVKSVGNASHATSEHHGKKTDVANNDADKVFDGRFLQQTGAILEDRPPDVGVKAASSLRGASGTDVMINDGPSKVDVPTADQKHPVLAANTTMTEAKEFRSEMVTPLAVPPKDADQPQQPSEVPLPIITEQAGPTAPTPQQLAPAVIKHQPNTEIAMASEPSKTVAGCTALSSSSIDGLIYTAGQTRIAAVPSIEECHSPQSSAHLIQSCRSELHEAPLLTTPTHAALKGKTQQQAAPMASKLKGTSPSALNAGAPPWVTPQPSVQQESPAETTHTIITEQSTAHVGTPSGVEASASPSAPRMSFVEALRKKTKKVDAHMISTKPPPPSFSLAAPPQPGVKGTAGGHVIGLPAKHEIRSIPGSENSSDMDDEDPTTMHNIWSGLRFLPQSRDPALPRPVATPPPCRLPRPPCAPPRQPRPPCRLTRAIAIAARAARFANLLRPSAPGPPPSPPPSPPRHAASANHPAPCLFDPLSRTANHPRAPLRPPRAARPRGAFRQPGTSAAPPGFATPLRPITPLRPPFPASPPPRALLQRPCHPHRRATPPPPLHHLRPRLPLPPGRVTPPSAPHRRRQTKKKEGEGGDVAEASAAGPAGRRHDRRRPPVPSPAAAPLPSYPSCPSRSLLIPLWFLRDRRRKQTLLRRTGQLRVDLPVRYSTLGGAPALLSHRHHKSAIHAPIHVPFASWSSSRRILVTQRPTPYNRPSNVTSIWVISYMCHMNFSFLALLPNEKPTKIILDEENQNNYISQAIVDILLQTGEIIVDGDQTFVEFHLKFLGRTQKRSVNYFDRAWCTIDPSRSYITLGKEWLEERHVAIDANQCIIQPPHLRGKFCFSKYISPAAKPVLLEKTVIAEKPLELVSITHHLCVEPIFVDTWDQDLFVESGFHLICDDVFEISPALTATNELQDVTRNQCNYDMIWSDLDAHILCRLQLFRRLTGLDIPMVTLLVYDFIIPLPLTWILRHFETRGRVFSKQGRMMGSEKLKRWFKPPLLCFFLRDGRTPAKDWRKALPRSPAEKASSPTFYLLSGETPAISLPFPSVYRINILDNYNII